MILSEKAATVQTSLSVFVISGCLALCVSYVSANFESRFEHRAEVVNNQFAILHGRALVFNGVEYYIPQFQRRILFPLALAAVSKIHVLTPTAWYLILRIATAW
jgi:predicted ATP-grasp superfamily ATP-dependent carboligase